jgi:amidohydrolase
LIDQKIIALRHKLHQNPEVSNQEVQTAQMIEDFIKPLNPDKVINVATHGKIFVFLGKQEGKTVMIRADLDALPIQEQNNIPYRSKNQGIAHLCGHDGHMAIVAGLAQKLAHNRPRNGKILLLFQPAEEVEQGARDVVEDPAFQVLKPDYVFALHNIPGVEKGKILLRKGSFAAASKGMTCTLVGKTAHAGEPEQGINPDQALAEIITRFHQLMDHPKPFQEMTLLTIIHLVLGEIAFGTSPGYAELRATLRAFQNQDMEALTNLVEKIIREAAQKYKLQSTISYSEDFPAVVNDPACVDLIEQVVGDLELNHEYLRKPFRWSEDFAYFTQKYPGVLFGLGSGLDQPQLHHPDFDFPDDILEKGINVFYGIVQKINGL